jgi:hypothetical protein
MSCAAAYRLRKVAILLFVTSCTACNQTTEAKVETYSGYYAYAFEVMDFFPDGKDERWLLQAGPPNSCIEAGNGFVYIQVRGTTTTDRIRNSEDGRIYSRDLYVSEILSCRPATAAEHTQVILKEQRRLCGLDPSGC